MYEAVICNVCSKETPHIGMCSKCYSKVAREMRDLKQETEDLRRYEREQYGLYGTKERPDLVLIDGE